MFWILTSVTRYGSISVIILKVYRYICIWGIWIGKSQISHCKSIIYIWLLVWKNNSGLHLPTISIVLIIYWTTTLLFFLVHKIWKLINAKWQMKYVQEIEKNRNSLFAFRTACSRIQVSYKNTFKNFKFRMLIFCIFYPFVRDNFHISTFIITLVMLHSGQIAIWYKGPTYARIDGIYEYF